MHAGGYIKTLQALNLSSAPRTKRTVVTWLNGNISLPLGCYYQRKTFDKTFAYTPKDPTDKGRFMVLYCNVAMVKCKKIYGQPEKSSL